MESILDAVLIGGDPVFHRLERPGQGAALLRQIGVEETEGVGRL